MKPRLRGTKKKAGPVETGDGTAGCGFKTHTGQPGGLEKNA